METCRLRGDDSKQNGIYIYNDVYFFNIMNYGMNIDKYDDILH